MQDLLTKYSIAVPLRDATALSIADALTKNFICIYGAPKAILTDQGTNFLSAMIGNLTKKFNTLKPLLIVLNPMALLKDHIMY